jgi:2-methylcitrate dehydratase PrpD
MAIEQEKELSRYLAELVHGIAASAVTEADRLIVRQHLLDGVASAFVGCKSATFKDLVGLTGLAEGGAVPDSALKLQDLGMLLAFAINGSVFEDGSREGACHPAAVVIPAVMAFAEGRSWEVVDKAIIAGYDIMIRVARSGNPVFARKGFHGTAIAAPFGAAATVSLLLGYDLRTTQQALCLAAMGSSGLMASFKQGSTQPLQVAWGVRNGIAAALLAGKGNEGYARIMEEGFFPAYLGSDGSDAVRLPLEYDYAIKGCYLKPFPGCRHMHASLDAFANVAARHGVRPEQIERISVGTYSIAITTGIEYIHKRGDAYFNIPYAIAARAVLGASDYEAFSETHFTNPAIVRLMEKISVSVDPEIEQRYPHQRGSKVEVHLVDGRTVAHRVEYALGEPENPLSVEATKEKFRENTRDVLSPAQIGEIARMLDATTGSVSMNAISALILGK